MSDAQSSGRRSLGQVLLEARKQLEAEEIATPGLDTRLMLQEATGLSLVQILADPETQITAEAEAKFNRLLLRRLKHEPVSRLFLRREFYGRTFKVTPYVLDPRPDTEIVVETALKLIKGGTFIDLGTGSGAIAITLCLENKNLSGVATDISENALITAQENASLLRAEHLQFRQASWLTGIDQKFDLIISNPPYIKTGASLMFEVSNYDPHIALYGGPDGLSAYREIAADAAQNLTTNGHVVLEIGQGQDIEIIRIFGANGFRHEASAKDLAGITRVLVFGL